MVAPLWPTAMLFTIISTGNHFVMDAMVGAMIPLVAWKYNQIVLIFEPIQDWIFSPFKAAGSAADFPNLSPFKSLVD
jgi:hypothetical protein